MRETTTKKYLSRDQSGYTWYIFYSGKANLCAIECLLLSSKYPYKLWVPGYKHRCTKDNDIISTMKRAFPGYIFVTFMNNEPKDPQECEGYITGLESFIKNQDGQFKLLRHPSGKAAGYTEERLKEVDEAIHDLLEKEPEIPSLKIDDFVRINSGPFTGMVGQVEVVHPKQITLKVFFLKQQVRMVVPSTHAQFLVQKA